MEQDGTWAKTKEAKKEYQMHLHEAVAGYVPAMLLKMNDTAYKGTWRGYDLDAYARRVGQEFEEVRMALYRYTQEPCDETREALMGELVDLGNTSMMMYDGLKRA